MPSQDESLARRIFESLQTELKSGSPKAQALLSELGKEVERADQRAEEAESKVAELAQAYEKLTSPANRIGVYLEPHQEGAALIAFGETDYVAAMDPKFEGADTLVAGWRVLLNDAYAIVGALPPNMAGTTMKVAEVLNKEWVKVGGDLQGSTERLVRLGAGLNADELKAGDLIRIEPMGRVAVERIANPASRDAFLEDVPETPWSAIGGQEEAVEAIRKNLEEPLLHPEIYKSFGKKPANGILLYGPPGCGKTLIGKAIAYNLAKEARDKSGKPMQECFLSISGPKILNMWLGESERMVREVFATARRNAKDGQFVVLFIDEAESLLRTRSSGRMTNISNTLVPQFCAEMDGMTGLENVIVVLTSNRPDYIDPAILRPGRIDRKIKVRRPTGQDINKILSIYLTEELPYDPALVAEHGGEECARRDLVEFTAAQLGLEKPETEIVRLTLRSGASRTLHYKDLISGALIKAIVDRAKDLAITRAIADQGSKSGLSKADFELAIRDEFRENEILPKSDAVEDWLMLLDFEPEQIVAVKPKRKSESDSVRGII